GLASATELVVGLRIEVTRTHAGVVAGAARLAVTRRRRLTFVRTELPVLRVVVRRVPRRCELVEHAERVTDLVERDAFHRLLPEVLVDRFATRLRVEAAVLLLEPTGERAHEDAADRRRLVVEE